MQTARFWGGRRSSSPTTDNNSTDRETSTNRNDELPTEHTALIPPSASENMTGTDIERGNEVEASGNETDTAAARPGDTVALIQETNNTETTPTNDPPRIDDSVIINLTNRLRCLFACLTVPIFPLGIFLFFLLLRLLYCAFVKDVSHSCSHPLKPYAVMSLALSAYFPQHKRVKLFLFGYQRERDGPVRPRSVRIYDQLFHLIVLNYVYAGMLLVQTCKDDIPASDDAAAGEMDLISTCQSTCPYLYGATRSYVLILQVLVIVFLLPLVCLPFIYLWIVRRVTTEEAWARFGRVAAGEDADDEAGVVMAKDILELMTKVDLIRISGSEELVKVVKRSKSGIPDLEEAEAEAMSSAEHLDWKLVKDCCICQDEFNVYDNDEAYLAQTARTELDSESTLLDDNGSPSVQNSQASNAPEHDIILQTKCGHLFHKECIEPWIYGPWRGDSQSVRPLNRRAARRCCPLCRRDLGPTSSTTPEASN